MKTVISILTLALFTLPYLTSTAQDSLLLSLAKENHLTFTFIDGQFSGPGWDLIKEKTMKSTNTLVGEDHFSNEIPQFIQALSDMGNFDNFYIEVDPYTTGILERSLKESSDSERREFNDRFGDILSFYSMKPEYDMLKHISDKGVKILGSDQVVMFSDQLVFTDVLEWSENAEAKAIYQKIIKRSKEELERFYNETKNPMTLYFMTDDFMSDLSQLQTLELSEEESRIVADMKRSVTIYKTQDHAYRVNLILNQLMRDYPMWKDSRTLFKYGANHLTRGESFLNTYDVGNMVANVTESNYQESFHIMIVGESGYLGSIFKIFPPSKIDVDKGFYLSYLKPFFSLTDENSWHAFNLVPLRKAISRNKLTIENKNLERAIRGYDVLVVIPEVTPAELIKQ